MMLTQFFAKQIFGHDGARNWLASNPVVLRDAMETHGSHLLKGAQNWLTDVSGVPNPEVTSLPNRFVVGRDNSDNTRKSRLPKPVD